MNKKILIMLVVLLMVSLSATLPVALAATRSFYWSGDGYVAHWTIQVNGAMPKTISITGIYAHYSYQGPWVYVYASTSTGQKAEMQKYWISGPSYGAGYVAVSTMLFIDLGDGQKWHSFDMSFRAYPYYGTTNSYIDGSIQLFYISLGPGHLVWWLPHEKGIDTCVNVGNNVRLNMFNAFYYDCWAYLTIDHGVSPYMTYYDSDAGIIAYGDINANVMT